MIYLASTWILPALIAITFHEAAHGFVARRFGDETAARLGRVSLNPLRHIDPFGTIILPALLLLIRSPFLFGYAKPVPVNFKALRHPRLAIPLVAAAGPATNIGLAILVAFGFYLVDLLPAAPARWLALNFRNALIFNVMLAVFNMLPLPPLDGGRIVLALLPPSAGRVLARLERYGLTILLVLLFVLPLIGSRLGLDIDIVSRYIRMATAIIIHAIIALTGR
jgi:Zn-dependent protease